MESQVQFGSSGPQGNKMKIVYTVVERGQNKSFWVRIGVGFVNSDGSMNLKLDAVPVNGSLQVRDWEPREKDDAPVKEFGRGRVGNAIAAA
jgi:hypothetical protein